MSDQDFFFDEEPAKKDDKPAKSAAGKSTAKSGGAPAKPAPAKAAPVATPFFEQNVSMAVAGMLGVIGILVGVIIGFLLGGIGAPATDTVLSNSPASTSTGVGAGGQTAPALTPEQMQQGTGGNLPAGHPKISGTPTTGTK